MSGDKRMSWEHRFRESEADIYFHGNLVAILDVTIGHATLADRIYVGKRSNNCFRSGFLNMLKQITFITTMMLSMPFFKFLARIWSEIAWSWSRGWTKESLKFLNSISFDQLALLKSKVGENRFSNILSFSSNRWNSVLGVAHK